MNIHNRKYTFEKRKDIIAELDALLKEGVSVSAYRRSMYNLGQYLAESFADSIDPNSSYCIASTAEDADFLAKGMLDELSRRVKNISFACFWNKHYTPVKNGPSIAPILKKYIDKEAVEAKNLIVVKSIISGSCVVKTNLTEMIHKMEPQKIYVASPVMHDKAEENLKKEFPKEISNKFRYNYLVLDSERTEAGEVVPGVGGNVYELLGFKSQDHKNLSMPNLIKERLAMAF